MLPCSPRCAQYRPDRVIQFLAATEVTASSSRIYQVLYIVMQPEISVLIFEAFEIKHLKLLGIFGYHFSYVFFPFLLHQVNTTCFREKLKIESILLVKLWNTEYLQETSIILGTSHKKVNICVAGLAIVSLIMFLLLFA